MRGRQFLILALVACSGCAPMVWVKPGATEADFMRDKAQCEYEVNSNVRAPQTAGLTTPVGAAFDMGMQKADLMRYCMKARGYQQVQAKPKIAAE